MHTLPFAPRSWLVPKKPSAGLWWQLGFTSSPRNLVAYQKRRPEYTFPGCADLKIIKPYREVTEAFITWPWIWAPPQGCHCLSHWFAWWSWAMSSNPHSFYFFMKKKGQANQFQGPFQPQSYMVRYDQVWEADWWRGRELFIGGSSMSVVNFPKAGDKWEIRLWPLLDIPFP